MASTNDQLDAKISSINQVLNNIQTAITNLASKQQLKQLTLLIQKDINDLKTRVAALEQDVQNIKNR